MLSVRYGPGRRILMVGKDALALISGELTGRQRLEIWSSVAAGEPVGELLGQVVESCGGRVDTLPDLAVAGRDGLVMQVAVRGELDVRVINPEAVVDTGPRAGTDAGESTAAGPRSPEALLISGREALAWTERTLDLPGRLSVGQPSEDDFVIERGIALVDWIEVTVRNPAHPVVVDGSVTYESISLAQMSASLSQSIEPLVRSAGVPAYSPLRKVPDEPTPAGPGVAPIPGAEPTTASTNSGPSIHMAYSAAPPEQQPPAQAGWQDWQQPGQQWQQTGQQYPNGYYGPDGQWYQWPDQNYQWPDGAQQQWQQDPQWQQYYSAGGQEAQGSWQADAYQYGYQEQYGWAETAAPVYQPIDVGEVLPGPKLPAILCANQHANPPHAEACRVCGMPIDGQIVPVERPALGRLWISDGRYADIVTGMIIGRSPEQVREGAAAVLITVASPQHDISRSHIEIRLEGWHVLVVDLDSRNGTEVLRGGQAPLVLSPLEPVSVHSTDVVHIGDGVSLTFEDIP